MVVQVQCWPYLLGSDSCIGAVLALLAWFVPHCKIDKSWVHRSELYSNIIFWWGGGGGGGGGEGRVWCRVISVQKSCFRTVARPTILCYKETIRANSPTCVWRSVFQLSCSSARKQYCKIDKSWVHRSELLWHTYLTSVTISNFPLSHHCCFLSLPKESTSW